MISSAVKPWPELRTTMPFPSEVRVIYLVVENNDTGTYAGTAKLLLSLNWTTGPAGGMTLMLILMSPP